jgi:4a-hydroxytetrahydrobiopterin dehydratase
MGCCPDGETEERYRARMTDTASSDRAIDTITITEFREAGGTEDWPVLADGAATFFATDSLATSAQLVNAIAEIEGVEDHRPDIDVRSDGITVRLVTKTDAWYGMSRRDVELARKISAIGRELRLSADRNAVQSVGPIVVGARDVKKVMPFWRALMGYVDRPDSPDADIVDPHDRGPGIWFEEIDESSEARNRMHVAVWVPYDQAEARVAAAVEAGGRIIFDRAAPAWWTLVDPEGNEADVATSMRRD